MSATIWFQLNHCGGSLKTEVPSTRWSFQWHRVPVILSSQLLEHPSVGTGAVCRRGLAVALQYSFIGSEILFRQAPLAKRFG